MRSVVDPDNQNFASSIPSSSNGIVNPASPLEYLPNTFMQNWEQYNPGPWLSLKLIDRIGASPVIPHDQIPTGMKNYFPEGKTITQADLDYAEAAHAETQQRAAITNSMPNTFLAKSSSWITSQLGAGLSPGGIASGVLLGGVGKLAMPLAEYALPKSLLTSIGEWSSAPFANEALQNALGNNPILSHTIQGIGSVARGASLGTVGMAALTPFQYVSQQAQGNPQTFGNLLVQNAQQGFYAGATVGLLHHGISVLWPYGTQSAVGFLKKTPVGSASESGNSLNLVQDQLMSDKQPNIAPITDNIINQTSQNISDEDLENLQSENAIYKSHIDILNNEIKDFPAPNEPDLTLSGNLLKTLNILRKNNEDRSNAEVNFRDNYFLTPYHEDLLEAHMADPPELDSSQQSLIDNINNTQYEKDALMNAADELNNNIDNYNSGLEDPHINWTDKRDLFNKKLDDTKLLDKVSTRLDQLKDVESNPDLSGQWNARNHILLNKDRLERYIEKNQAAINTKLEAAPPTNHDINTQLFNNTLPETDLDHDTEITSSYSQYENPTSNLSHEDVDITSLPDNLQEALNDEADNHMTLIKKLQDVITNTLNCLRGKDE